MLQLTLLLAISPRTVLFIVVVLLLFFGAKRIPELFRGIGQGVREFKDASTEQPRPPYQAPGQPNQPYGQPGQYPGQAPYQGQPNQAYGQPHPGYQGQPNQPYGQPTPGQLPNPPAAPYNPNNPAA